MKRLSILVVEDDEYKINDICGALPKHTDRTVVRSVASAVRAVVDGAFDLIMLDIALPTFEKQTGAASGSSQPQGGVEVLRALNYAKSTSRIIIISQYPGIEIDGVFVSLSASVQALNDRYDIDVVGSVAYDFEDNAWINEFKNIMSKL